MIKHLSIKEVEYLAFSLARKLMSFNEPVPDFTTRFPNVLESCLAASFQTFNKKPLYRGLTGKAAALFYLIIKNHPFQNGNKRIAITTLLVFLYKNKKWLKVDNQELYNFSVWIAESPTKLKNDTMRAIKHFLQRHLINLEQD